MCFKAKKTCHIRIQPIKEINMKLVPNLYVDFKETQMKWVPRPKIILDKLHFKLEHLSAQKEKQIQDMQFEEENHIKWLGVQIEDQNLKKQYFQDNIKCQLKEIEELKREILMVHIDDEVLRILKQRDEQRFNQLKGYKFEFLTPDQQQTILNQEKIVRVKEIEQIDPCLDQNIQILDIDQCFKEIKFDTEQST